MKAKEIKSNCNYPRYKVFEYRGVKINIEYDPFPDSPGTWDNEDCFLIGDANCLNVENNNLNIDHVRDVMEENKRMFVDGYWIFPVSIYSHSGVVLYLEELHGWDYSNGYAFVAVKRQAGWSWQKEEAFKIAKEVIVEWNQYLLGDIYGYKIKGIDIVDDSGWGYYGDDSIPDMVEEAEGIIDCYFDKTLKQHLQKQKKLIKHRTPLYVRETYKDAI